MAAGAWLVLGLGNPGDRYRATRHNVGQMVVEELAARAGARYKRHPRVGAMVAEGRTAPGAPKLVLARSSGFMNTSGGPASQLLAYYGLGPEALIVVHDDLDLPFDTLKLKRSGGHGGHNGLRDISAAIGPDYLRVRVGIGRPPGRQDVADFVLRPFSTDERATLPNLITDAADAVELITSQGLVAAQQIVHARVG